MGLAPSRRETERSGVEKESRVQRAKRYKPIQVALSEEARDLIGKRDRIEVDGTRFNADCSGTMLAVFFAAGLDLRPGFNRAQGSTGVEKLYHLMESSHLLDDSDLPQPGSLVFWDDTYDRNGDGKRNDPLTHVGIIVSAESDGDLRYVHYHYRNGVVEERMNLRHPTEGTKKSGGADVIVNSPLRMKSWKPDAESLSGELFRISARSYEFEADSGKTAGTRVGLLD
jgi:cell wall-associated NlpC family hydrolase